MIKKIDDKLKNYPCDLCGRRNEEYLYNKQGVLSTFLFRVVRCRSCGLIYINPRLAEEAIKDLYDGDYYDGEGFDTYVNYISDYEKEKDIDKIFRTEQKVKIIKELVHPPAALLDFGCGLGDFVRQAVKYGYDAEGFEVSKYSVRFVRSRGFKVYDSLQDIPHNKYDIVTAIEVLEHCSSPMEVLSKIYYCLKPGGTFYYTTENFDWFYEKWKLGIKDVLDGYIVPEGHIHFFSTHVMEMYFSKIGYSDVFCFEPRTYIKHGRLFRRLNKIGLTDSSDIPESILTKLSYYGLRKVITTIGLRRKTLPIARR